MTYNIQVLNKISEKGLSQFPKQEYVLSEVGEQPDAILLRSANIHDMEIPEGLAVVGRAGAGTNNIPIDRFSAQGIPVFNTPGANANAVKELVIAGLLLASRNLCEAWVYASGLSGDDKALHEEVEKGKKQFVGCELPGRTLAVIGLGAIGAKVANAALALDMKVIGFDPSISVERAWELSSGVVKATSLDQALKQADYISIHVPLIDATRGLISADKFSVMKSGVILLNFARQPIIDEAALLDALSSNKVARYVCDFPTEKLQKASGVIALPHLGASTKEAEENCAVMIVDQIKDYLENGNIKYSVNFPAVMMPRSEGVCRLAVSNANVPNMVGQVSTILAEAGFNIVDMINKSRGEIAYTLMDLDRPIDDSLKRSIESIEGVLKVRVL